MKLSDHYATEVADDTIKIYLNIDGNETEHYIEVYTGESFKGRSSSNRYRQRCLDAALLGKPLIAKAPIGDGNEATEDLYRLNCFRLAENIKGWSFEDDLTEELASSWLLMNPEVARQIEEKLYSHQEAIDKEKKH